MDLQAIPDSWAATNLGSIVDYGKTQKCELADIDGVTWVVELEDIEKDTSRIISRGYTPARDFKSSKNLFNKGDILYGKLRPYLNKVVMADENGVCSTEIIPINAEPLVINKYIFYWIKSHHFLDYVNDVSYGVNMPRLGTNDGLNAPFILAPFAEQKEIVDRLDILLAQVEATQARLARIPDIIKRFRQSVLSAAMSGKLTEEWRSKNTVNQPRKEKLASVISFLDQGWSPKCINEPVQNNQWGVIKTSAVQPGFFLKEENKTLPEELKPRTTLTLLKDDILITRAGPRSRCGITCIVDDDYPNLMICDKVYRIRTNVKHLLPQYLNWCLNSPTYLSYIEELKTGISESGMNMTQNKLNGLIINLPQVEEQTEIVRRVEQLFAYADSIELQAKAAKARVDNLTQAILAKAFRGELTADWRAANPVLISSDNSAAALLARIQAKRVAVKPRKSRRV
ncbi:restriction endonuclease subunit S [Aeromonas caviae]|uniref:restriction endonuclease subunit S n=1 Tax=Aeromonas TaxID=642 RepID=UPI0005B3659F|nr:MULTISPECIES: restriction endonuclease subunit S [Aeromonas]TNH77352.1 restriction endonuclease subunit S [Aeromonas caviae]